ncbi:hypothetical protein ACPSKX_03010 [Moritella viscosa]
MSKPYPLGAHLQQANNLTKQGCNFAIYAPDCRNLQLVLFNDKTQRSFTIKNKYAGIHHIFIPAVTAGQEYGFSTNIDGQDWLLLDPYAKAVSEAPYYQPPYDAEKSWLLTKAIVIDNAFDPARCPLS